MKTTLVLIAVTMLTAMTIAAAGTPLREEQYRAKYGRYTPAYEARRTAPTERSQCCQLAHATDRRFPAAREMSAVALVSASHNATCGSTSPNVLVPVSVPTEGCGHGCCHAAE